MNLLLLNVIWNVFELKAGIILVEIFKRKKVKYKENLRIFAKVSTYTYSMTHLLGHMWIMLGTYVNIELVNHLTKCTLLKNWVDLGCV